MSWDNEVMLKRKLTKPDTVKNARRVVLESVLPTEERMTPITQSLISQVMSEMGRKGGKIGGKRRLVTLTKKRRSEIASNAAKTRWTKNG